MKKEYSWTEDEFIRMQLGIPKIPGVVPPERRILSRIIIVVGLFFLFRGLMYAIDAIRTVCTGEEFSFFLWFFALGFMYCFVPLGLAFLCFYKIFLARKFKIRRYLKNNRNAVAEPRTVKLIENVFSISTAESCSEWTLGPSSFVFRTEEFLYGTVQEEKGARQVVWAIPRRIFDEEDETQFIEQCRKYCRAENAGEIVLKEDQENGQESVEALASSKTEVISQAVALCLQIVAFSLLLVSVEKLPGRMAFNYWIYSVFICIIYLLIYLFTAIDCIKKEKDHKLFVRANLILVILLALLFLPVGQVGDEVAAYIWSGLLAVLFVFQLRVFWLLLKRYQKGTVIFHRVFRLAGLAFFGLALIHLILFVIYLRKANLKLDSFYETASVYLAYDWMVTHKTPDKLFDCAAQWVYGVTAVCGACLCFLVDGVVSVFQNRRNLPWLFFMTGGTVLFVLSRRCLSAQAFALWTGTLCVLLSAEGCGMMIWKHRDKANQA